MLPLIASLFLSLSAFIVEPAFASEHTESIASWINHNQCQKDRYLEDAKELKGNAELQVKNILKGMDNNKNKTCSGVTNPVLHELQNNNDPSDKSILIFVSLSMPKESLQNLYKEAESKGIPLIIRGLKNNSFKETAEAIKDLSVSVQIDPNLFDEYEIQVVPTFVALNKSEPLQIKGNISLSYAQRKFEEAP